nr:MAG TPA: hypothetical protein [Caudoviricetes sp.]
MSICLISFSSFHIKFLPNRRVIFSSFLYTQIGLLSLFRQLPH